MKYFYDQKNYVDLKNLILNYNKDKKSELKNDDEDNLNFGHVKDTKEIDILD